MSNSNLAKFLRANPHADLVVVPHVPDWPFAGEPNIFGKSAVRYSVTQRDIQVYSRRRDAYRALKELGYRQEGIFWRFVPVAEREKEHA